MNLPDESDTESQQSALSVDGITSSANGPLWIVDGSSLEVEMDVPSFEGSGDMLEFESLLVTALDQAVESEVVIATPSSAKLVTTTTAGIASYMNKGSDPAVQPGTVAAIAVVTSLSALLLIAGVVFLVWCLLRRRFRKVNVFKRSMSSFDKNWKSKRKVVSVGAKTNVKGPSSKTLVSSV